MIEEMKNSMKKRETKDGDKHITNNKTDKVT